MSDETTLLPCPFCGGEAEVHPSNDWDAKFTGSTYFAWCDKCETRGDYYNTEAEAIAAWNSRAERTCRSTTDDSAWCFVCSECGKSFPRSKLHLAHNHGEINYCPNCGANVIQGVDNAD